MAEKKKIACRVCGKLFTPCSYCESKNDEFKWRNFACSLKCAKKYVNDTIAHREELHNKDNKSKVVEIKSTIPSTTAKEKINKYIFNSSAENKMKEKATNKNVKNDKTNIENKEADKETEVTVKTV